MSGRKNIFPFTAIVGQEKMKKALILNAINPALGGVLIRGEKGTCKSTAARALAALLPEIDVVNDCPYNCNPDQITEMCPTCRERAKKGETLPRTKRKIKVVDLPLGATEDRVLGTLNIEHAIKTGQKIFEPGLLAEVHRGILYVDEVNLLDDHLVDILLDAVAMGVNVVEREGVSYSHPSRFILIGTMNPEEGELRPQLLDRFGLCVEVQGLTDPALRAEVVKRYLEYENNPHEFEATWEEEQKRLRETIMTAREIYPSVSYSEEILELITRIAIDMGVDGHRADIAMLKTARTIAAYHQRKEVLVEDVREAAELVLPHRLRKKPFQEPQAQDDKIKDSIDRHSRLLQNKHDTVAPAENQEITGSGNKSGHHQHTNGSAEINFEVGAPFSLKKLTTSPERTMNMSLPQSGRRSKVKTQAKSGRYVRSAIPDDKTNDIAFDATLRAAAPHQYYRETRSQAVVIEPQDLRRKVREKKIGSTIVFVVDSSASMGVNKRMIATKGAILSLLMDAYQKRDKIGLVAFKGNEAQVLLPPTSNVEQAKKYLEVLPTGGRTPLSKGLLLGYELLQKEQRLEPKTIPILILISDGKANVSILEGNNVFDEIRKVGEQIRMSNIKGIVIDTESGFVRLGKSREIAEILNAAYYNIEDLKADSILKVVSEYIERSFC